MTRRQAGSANEKTKIPAARFELGTLSASDPGCSRQEPTLPFNGNAIFNFGDDCAGTGVPGIGTALVRLVEGSADRRAEGALYQPWRNTASGGGAGPVASVLSLP